MRVGVKTQHPDEVIRRFEDAEPFEPYYDLPVPIVRIGNVESAESVAWPPGVRINQQVIEGAELISAVEETGSEDA